jgi:hypothetical protein
MDAPFTATAVPTASIAAAGIRKTGVKAVERAAIKAAEVDAAKIETSAGRTGVECRRIEIDVAPVPAIPVAHRDAQRSIIRPQLLDEQNRTAERRDKRRRLSRIAVEKARDRASVVHQPFDPLLLGIARRGAPEGVYRDQAQQPPAIRLGQPARRQRRSEMLQHKIGERTAIRPLTLAQHLRN